MSASSRRMLRSRQGNVPTVNLLLNKLFTSSVGDVAGNPLSNVTDGNASSRWISNIQSPATIQVDIGKVHTLRRIEITWAADTTKDYTVQVSSDNATWATVATGATNGAASAQKITHAINASGRYIKVNLNSMHNATYGNSIYEIEAYSTVTSGGGTGGTGGSAIFSTTTNKKIMFIGDSITWGQGNTATEVQAGWRGPLVQKMNSKGWLFTQVGSVSTPAGMGANNHEGWQGWSCNQIQAGMNGQQPMATKVASFQPDIITLFLGTNDFGIEQNNSATAANDFTNLLNALLAVAPNAYYFIAGIPPSINLANTSQYEVRVEAYNDALKQLVASKVAQGSRMTFVDMRSVLGNQPSNYSETTGWGVHPSVNGYNLIADAWFNGFVAANDAATGNGGNTGTGGGTIPSGTRDAFKHPFKSTSPWNLPIKNNVQTTYDGTLFARTAWMNYGQFSHCLVMGSASDPLVTCVDTDHGNYTEQWRIPSWVQPSYGTPGGYADLHMAIVNQMSDGSLKVCEMFGCYNRTTNYIQNKRMKVIDLRGDGLGPDAGVRAWGGSSIGGLIRQWEIEAGEINHAIAIAIDMDNQLGKSNQGSWNGTGYYWDGSVTNTSQQPGWNPGRNRNGFGQQLGYVWPASEQDGFSVNKYGGNIPMGTYYCIPSSVDIATKGWNASGMMVAKAMQDYGVYVTDATSGAVITYVEYFYGGTQSSAADAFINDLGSNIGAITGELRRVIGNSENTPNGTALSATDRRKALLPNV